MAGRAGVRLLAISDHDTIDGLPEARAEAELRGLTLIPAVELSVTAERQDLHILGYFVEQDHAGLLAHLAALRGERDLRLEETLSRLKGLGIELSEEAVRREVEAGASVGRTHVARALVATGHAVDIDAAFRRYLRDGGPAHVPKRTPSIEESLAMLLEAGGVPVLAHPNSYRLEPVFWRLVRAGLLGLEVIHPSQPPAEVERLRSLARSWGLCETGGSDYHGHREVEMTPGSLEIEAADLGGLARARDLAAQRRRKCDARI